MDQYLNIAEPSDYSKRFFNTRFNKEMAKYLYEERGKVPLCLEVSNEGDHFADDVKVSLSAPISAGIIFKDESDLLSRPERYNNPVYAPAGPYTPNRSAPRHSIKKTDAEVVVIFNLGKIQAGETRRTSKVYVINPPPAFDAFDVRILSDQLRGAVTVRMSAKIELTSELLTMEQLRTLP
jgi:hypothetical protein